jgi:hypothetical protein
VAIGHINECPSQSLLIGHNSQNGYVEFSANRPVQPPQPNGKPEQDWFIFDKEEGVEKIWLIWSEQSVPELEAVKGWANPKDKGTIVDPSQIKVVAQYLATQAANTAKVEKDEASRETKIKGKGKVLVGLVKLGHH